MSKVQKFFSLDLEIVVELEKLESRERSKFVNEAIKDKLGSLPDYEARLKKEKELKTPPPIITRITTEG